MEEIAQDFYYDLARSDRLLKAFDSARGTLAGFLFGAARRRARRSLRKLRNEHARWRPLTVEFRDRSAADGFEFIRLGEFAALLTPRLNRFLTDHLLGEIPDGGRKQSASAESRLLKHRILLAWQKFQDAS